jgi:hypothetical protein
MKLKLSVIALIALLIPELTTAAEPTAVATSVPHHHHHPHHHRATPTPSPSTTPTAVPTTGI